MGRGRATDSESRFLRYVEGLVSPKIRDEILEDGAALGGMGFPAHIGE